jgi:ubiquinone/menaquinone biosynthesis C-methylase UbiE
MNIDNTKRFSNRVEDYIKYRPTYPNEMINVLKKELGLTKDKVIADIGSGTGISSIPFLKNENRVFGIEPNTEMREAQEQILKQFSNFTSINGTAEETNLDNNSVDLIFCAQAFHWFDKEKSKKEFSRILKENGNLVFVWNSRSTKTEFQIEYEQILYNNIEEYKNVNHRNIEELDIEKFFNPKTMIMIELENEQTFDLDGLKGRLQSSSYCPKDGSDYKNIMNEIENLFIKYQNNNLITFHYETKIYFC